MYQPNLQTPPTDLPAPLPFSFPLDPFQQHAVSAISKGHNVFVCAKTGSGKTLVGEYQIHHSLSQAKRVFYTTPIKSLSNQKFHDLKTQFPQATVGIMTGDIKFCPQADILVMTTEILRNLLYKRGTQTEHLGLTASISLDRLDAVIFDECHYINDPDRGRVWEETMILLPQEIKLIALSATLASPDLFTGWLANVRERPTALIQTTYRIVPLTHTIADLAKEEFITILDSKEQFHDYAYNNWLYSRQQAAKAHEAYQRQVATARRQGHEGPVEGKTRPKDFVHELNQTVELLQRKSLLPALVFSLSRRGCEQLAAKITSDLLTSSETASVNHIINFHLSRYKELETLPQYHFLTSLLSKGIAFHHSGLLPVLKEIVELLFSRGLVRLLFATETFAVGLNMPTKTVVFTGLKKYDDSAQGMRLLRTDEYTQMAGRAGRRGKDKEGLVIYLPDRDPLPLSEMRQVMKGALPPIQSRMTFHYDFLLKTLQSDTLNWLKIQDQSYWSQQRAAQLKGVQEQLAAALQKAEKLLTEHGGEQTFSELAEKEAIEVAIRQATNARRKELSRKLNQWNDGHMGPKWVNAQKVYGQYKQLIKEAEDASALLADAEKNRLVSVEQVVEFLIRTGYLTAPAVSATPVATGLTRSNLTLRGTLATEVNEGHCILLPELFLSEKTRQLTAIELLQILAVFLEAEKDNRTAQASAPTPAVNTVLDELDTIAQRFLAIEDSISTTLSPPDYWSLNTYWVEPLTQWANGTELVKICSDFGIFEGNFTRAVLKIANICDEWLSLALFCQVPAEVEKINALRPLLIRGAVQPDSLYLRI